MSDEVMRSLVRDDAYHVVRVLADGPTGRTELVTLDGEGPVVRKRIPAALANPMAWGALIGVQEPLLPQVESMYRMPDELVVLYDYVEGVSLRDVMEQRGSLPAEEATDIACDLCLALSVLHQRGVVHRDVTAGNVVVASDGAHLVDLGIARHVSEGAPRDTTTLGTWGFAAPEQFGFAQTDARSDIYALGRLLGFMLTGVQPGEDGFDQALRDADHVDPRLTVVVERATAFEPSSRYQTAAELRDALEKARAPVAPPSTMTGAASPLESVAEQAVPAVLLTRARSLGDAPLLERAALTAVIFAAVIWILLVFFTSLSELVEPDGKWGIGQYLLGVATCLFVAAVTYEVYQAVRCTGPYEGKAGRAGILVFHLAIYVALLVTFALLVLPAILLFAGV